MSLVRIRVNGCDDSTSVVLDLAPDELAGVETLAEQVNLHAGGCKPGIKVDTDVHEYRLIFTPDVDLSRYGTAAPLSHDGYVAVYAASRRAAADIAADHLNYIYAGWGLHEAEDVDPARCRRLGAWTEEI